MLFFKNFNYITKCICSKKLIFELFFVFFLVISNFIIGFGLRESIADVMFPGDDPLVIIIANDFRENKSFQINYLGNYVFWETSYDDIIEKYPTISFNSGKNSSYFILLGTFFQLFETSHENLQLHASIFNNVISSIFLVLFFFLIRKYFNFKIAFLSSTMILFLPYFEFYSVFVRPHMLMYVFSLSALFFIQKKKLHYVLFGIFVGLAHFTHPIGIILGFSYVVFLLIHKEFKGVIISFFSWQLILIPVFIKNYIDYGDIGVGLYIPFSNIFSPLLSSIIVRADSNVILHPGSVIYERIIETNKAMLFDVLHSSIQKFSINYSMNLILLFITICPILYFFKINQLLSKKNIIYLFFIFVIFILSFYVASLIGFFAQMFLIFVFPVLFVIILKKIRKKYFVNDIPRYSVFIMIFAFITLIAYYFTSLLLNYSSPDPSQLMLSIFLLIPLAVMGMINVINHNYFNKNKKNKIIKRTIPLLIILPIILISGTGIDFNNYAPEYHRETLDVKLTDSWLINESGNIKNIASTDPLHTTYRTNIKSVPTPIPFDVRAGFDRVGFEKYLNHFNVSHMIFYGLTVDQIGKKYESIFEPSMNLPYFYEPVFIAVNSTIISRENVLFSDISKPLQYLGKAKYLENIDSNESKKILDEVHNLNLDALSFCKIYEPYSIFDEVLYRCKQVIEFEPHNQIALNNLLISYLYYGEPKLFIENHIEKFDWSTISDRVSFHLHNNESVSHFWPELIQILVDSGHYDDAIQTYDPIITHYQNRLDKSDSISYKTLEKMLIDTLKAKVNLLTMLEDYHAAHYVNLEIISINRTDAESWFRIAQYHEKYEQWEQALNAYEFLQKIDSDNLAVNKKIEELKLIKKF